MENARSEVHGAFSCSNEYYGHVKLLGLSNSHSTLPRSEGSYCTRYDIQVRGADWIYLYDYSLVAVPLRIYRRALSFPRSFREISPSPKTRKHLISDITFQFSTPLSVSTSCYDTQMNNSFLCLPGFVSLHWSIWSFSECFENQNVKQSLTSQPDFLHFLPSIYGQDKQ